MNLTVQPKFSPGTPKAFQTAGTSKTSEIFRFGELSANLPIRLRTIHARSYKIADMSSLKFERDDEEKRFEHRSASPTLSTGEKQHVYLLLPPTNTLEAPTLLLLDEADLGMHIDWKRYFTRTAPSIPTCR